ncbi:hypothetical protein [Roseateles cavernae]|uniref:hypothetical protein n=1 Tax=Roseateles cavernae TaxID=3153578 RepID=UPI0032E488FC
MYQLHAQLRDFLRQGLSIHVGACDAAGLPTLSRALAVQQRQDARLALLLPALPGQPLIAAVAQTAQVACVFCQPSTHVAIQIKGRDARVEPARTADWPELAANHKDFTSEIGLFGFGPEFADAWFDGHGEDLQVVSFLPTGAWNQTPGPGAGAPMELFA